MISLRAIIPQFNVYPVHNGEASGLPGRILVCLTGLVLPTLYVTGLLHWLKKRRTQNGRPHNG